MTIDAPVVMIQSYKNYSMLLTSTLVFNEVIVQPIAILCETLETEKAKQLAEELSLPFIEKIHPDFSWFLCVTAERLELRENTLRRSRPLFVDFGAEKKSARVKSLSKKNELLARAVGVSHQKKLQVLDVTAGFGMDAFILSQFNCDVLMLERSPILFALLRDGLQRYPADNLSLLQSDSLFYLQHLTPEHFPDVIYLDPMYPSRKKTAAHKKEMQVLRTLVGDDNDASLLLNLALQKTKNRVVVKRPDDAGFLNEIKPHHSIEGKSVRFDVYAS